MTRLILSAIGVLYLGLGIWCAVQPGRTSRTVGFTLERGAGESEFLTIYGGLEFALGLIFLAPLVWPQYERPALLACLVVHAGIVLFRSAGFLLYSGIPRTTVYFAVAEVGLLALCVWRTVARS